MTAQHTPGPWTAEHGVVTTQDGDVLANVPYTMGDEHDHANARLIAAAPELLAVLRECAKQLRLENCPAHAARAEMAVDSAENGSES